MDKVSLAAFTPLRLSLTEIVITGCEDAVNPPVAGESRCRTGAMVSTVTNVETKAFCCTLPLRSVSPLTRTVKLAFADRGAAGVKTACVDVANTVLPETAPAGPVRTTRVARLVVATRGSLKFTIMVLLAGTRIGPLGGDKQRNRGARGGHPREGG